MPSIDIAANTRQAQSQVKDLSGALDDVGDSLDDVAREATRGGDGAGRALDKLGDAGKDAGRDISTAGDRIEGTFRDLQRQSERTTREVSKDARTAGKGMADGYKHAGDEGERSMHRIEEGAGEVRNEFGQNLGQAVSSFRGDLADLGQVGQDSLGGLAATVAGMGPAGLAGAFALAAGAAGLGLLTQGIQDAKEREEEAAQAAADWAAKFVESGQTIATAADVIGGVTDIATDKDKYKKAGENAKKWGVDTSTAMQAMAGDSVALDVVRDRVAGLKKTYDRARTAAEKNMDWSKQTTAAVGALGDAYLNAAAPLDKLTGEMSRGKDIADNVSKSLIAVAGHTKGATKTVDKFGNTIYNLPDGKKVYIDAETGKATQDADEFKQHVDDMARKPRVINFIAKLNDDAVRGYVPRPIRIPGYVDMGKGHQATWQ